MGYFSGITWLVVSLPLLPNYDSTDLTLRHVMTGIGAYFYLTWGIWLRHCLNGKQDDYELIWPRTVTSMPMVVRRRNAQNGRAKKSR
jgi:hypothetical protein